MFKRKIDNLRLHTGGLIDRETALNFSFNGKPLTGFSGDTVGSALAANGIKLLARSFKYHRVRGLYSAGPEEPNALLSIEIDGRVEVNARVTMITLREGMQLRSQNCAPSLEFDIGAINDKLSPLLSAGFYYKTFIWPGLKGWMFYEKIIRKAAGMGNTGLTADNANYEHLHLHCDLLVIGAGLAGISTALAAANSGLDVVLVEQHSQIGGQLSEQPQHKEWQRSAVQKLAAHSNIRLLTQTTAFGAYDNKVYTLLERTAAPCAVLERLLEVKAAQCVAATGAIERPLVFVNNDLPGVQLAGSAQLYLHRYATLPGREIVIFCNNNSAYQVAADLLTVGANLRALIDVRERAQISLTLELQKQIDSSGIELHYASVVSRAEGDKQLRRVQVNNYLNGKVAEKRHTIACDSLLVSGGWSPTAHLHSQAGGKLHYNEQLAALVPIATSSDVHNVGAAGGDFNLSSCVQQAWQLGQKLAQDDSSNVAINSTEKPSWLTLDIAESEYQIQALWSIAGKGKSFVDLQHDVSTADIELAAREGYQSVEHLKRYTTLGMATDQGKLSNVNALALMAEQLGQSIDQTGTTRFRPPYTPVTIGAWGANETGHHLTPTRRTPMQQWHAANGAHFNISGPWRRATDYRRLGETKREATIREASHVRKHAGLVDVSSLGKIRVCGPDALKLLNLVYVGSFDTLKIARARYGVMLREDGMVFDDGTVVRLDTDDYLITTTTSNAGLVLRHFDRLTQVDWPELAVACTSVTDQYAAMAIAGPKSREMLQTCIADIDFADEALPFMGYAKGHLGQIPVEICRISFSGEMAYELYTGADYGSSCWQTLLSLNPLLQVYGLDALDTLRIEKGHLTGAEIDGRRTLDDIGMSGMNRGTKPFIGQVMAQRSGLQSDRLQIVGLRSIDPSQILEEGMHLVKEV
ncbi:MAG: FAD-dependent oxidoreductase, partial [Oceanospirillaceae bacterium]